MRKTGLEKLNAEVPSKRPAYLVPAIVAGTVMAFAIGYVVHSGRTGADEVEGGPLDAETLNREATEAGLDGTTFADFLIPNDAVRAFASAAVRGKSSDEAKARAIVAKLRAYAAEHRFVQLPMHTPRDTPPLTAARALASLRPNARFTPYSFEIVAIAVAALRAEGVDAMVAEAYSFPGARTPADPSGRIGYYLVSVPKDEGGDEPLLLDPFGGHTRMPARNEYRVLNDVQALAAIQATNALYMLVHGGDVSGAMEQAQAATTLDERSPSARCVRAAVLISSGGLEEGEAELRSALDLRADPPRQANLAGVFVATNRTAEATRAIDEALEDAPDYVYAITIRAAIHLSRGEPDQAKAELERAERLEPDFYMLPMLWAQFFLRTGDKMSAVARTQVAIEQRPRDYQTLFQAVRVFESADQHALAVSTARRALELVPPDQREALRARVEEMLGAGTMSDEASADGAAGEGADPALGTGDPSLDLSRGSRLLGGGGGGTSGPRLLNGGLRLGGGQ